MHGLVVSSIDFRIKQGLSSNPYSATASGDLKKMLKHSEPQFLYLNRDGDSTHLM